MQEELAMCQRYYWESAPQTIVDLCAQSPNPDTVTTRVGTIFFPVEMRVPPTITKTLSNGTSTETIGTTQCRFVATVANDNQPTRVDAFTADAEIT